MCHVKTQSDTVNAHTHDRKPEATSLDALSELTNT